MFSNICSCDLLMSVNTFTVRSEWCFAAAHMQTPRTSILGFWTVFFPECLSRRRWTVHLRLQCSLLRWALLWDQVCALLAAVPCCNGLCFETRCVQPHQTQQTFFSSLFLPWPLDSSLPPKSGDKVQSELDHSQMQSDWGLGLVSNQSRVGGWKLTVL